MRTVWKYEIPVRDEPTSIQMPARATLLPVADCPGAGRSVYIWALVDTDERKFTHTFFVRGTGHEVPGVSRPVATAIYHQVGPLGWLSSPLVWHVFEVTS